MNTKNNALDVNQSLSGNILLFYSFDVGDDVDLQSIKSKNLLEPFELPPSSYFKNYRVPLSFKLEGTETPIISENKGSILGHGCILSRVYHFGAMSFCYQIPFNDTIDNLKMKLIDIKKEFDLKSELDAKQVFHKINSSIKKPRFFNLKNDYFAIHVNPLAEKIISDDFKELFGAKIASLLRLEIKTLSEYQIDQILESSTGYYGQDLIIIDSKSAFIYDNEYLEPLEFFESANVQLLEFQYYDRLIDQKLNFFYSQQTYKVPLRAYLPLIGERFDSSISRLAKMRVDISVITEQLENTVKMTGDAYYLKFYSVLVEKLYLKDWRESINRKLNIVHDLHMVYHERLDTIHEELLTVVIIILIAFEATMAFMR
jgi:hypothetical protein